MRVRFRLRRADPALGALLACVALLGLASALATPVGAGSDEVSHLAYVQSMAERGRPPTESAPTPAEGYVGESTEQRSAQSASGVGVYYGGYPVRPLLTKAAERRWRAERTWLSDSARSDGGGPNALAYVPPGYYALMVVPYKLAGGTWFDRALALRVASMLLVLVATWLAWALARVLGCARIGALVCAATVGLNPYTVELAGGVNPDSAVLALWTAGLAAGAALLVRGPTRARVAALLLALAALLLVKPTGLGLIPAVGLCLAMVTAPRVPARWRLPVAAATLVACAAAGAALVAVSTTLDHPLVSGGEDLSRLPTYLAHFYLPVLPGDPFPGLRSVFGVFGFGGDVASSLGPALIGLTTLAGLVVAVRRRAVDRRVAVFLALASLALVAGIHWTEFKSVSEGHGSFSAARYFLPLTPVAGLCVAAALSRLPERWRTPAAGLFLALCAGSCATWLLTRMASFYA